jgi:hypothetical protein
MTGKLRLEKSGPAVRCLGYGAWYWTGVTAPPRKFIHFNIEENSRNRSEAMYLTPSRAAIWPHTVEGKVTMATARHDLAALRRAARAG